MSVKQPNRKQNPFTLLKRGGYHNPPSDKGTDGPPPAVLESIFKTMAKKINTSRKTEITSSNQGSAIKGTTKRKSTLTETAVKVVAAVAAGVGGALAAKRSRTSHRKAAPPDEVPAHSRAATQNKVSSSHVIFTQEDIALRAYFLSEKRRTSGAPADPHQDWLDAERELTNESTSARL
ncbi:MAG: DUF2934 domain-containing protein [Verrucomicrobiaceae bacterium]|nr:MAG: DUF2934 domain-containing protein [Verrucomicrobiaceae bacterium]